MKYLKYFELASAYEAYKNGSDYVTPNVIYVEENNNVLYHLNKQGPQLITFTVIGKDGSTPMEKTFYAEEGMTWNEWVNTDYNTDGFIVEFYDVLAWNRRCISNTDPDGIIINNSTYTATGTPIPS